MVRDVDEATFAKDVIERSGEVPVVVDFWAAWCGPCRQLGPAIEKAVNDRDGRVELAKVDVDRNQQLATSFQVQGIPAVKAFRDGKVVDEFTGALPPPQIEAFLDRLVPSPEEEAARAAIESGDEDSLRAALEADPRNAATVAALAGILLGRGENEEVARITEPLATTDLIAGGLNARAALAASGDPSANAFEAWDEGSHDAAMEAIQAEVPGADPDRRDLLRRVMVGWFTELGPESELASGHRRRLSSALS